MKFLASINDISQMIWNTRVLTKTQKVEIDRGGRDEMVRVFLGVTWMDRIRNEYI